MSLSLEEYIAKRKRVDSINEFEPEHRIENMGKCINYVVEYFEKYLDPQKINFEVADRKKKAEIFRKQLRDYDPHVVDWIIDIYEKHGKRIDLSVSSYLKRDLYFMLSYQDEEFENYADSFIKEYIEKMLYLTGQKEMVTLLIKNYFKKRSSFPDNLNPSDYRLGEQIIKWLQEIYRDYSVNLMTFALDYASYFFHQHVEFACNLQYGTVDTVKDYDVKTITENLFDIDNLYEEINDRPFIKGHKLELEILIMHIWLDQICGENDYWDLYLNKNEERRKLTNSGVTNRLVLVQYKDPIFPGGVSCNLKMVEGHFDIDSVTETGRYILNTEFSYCRRKFKSKAMSNSREVLKANEDGVPLLWHNKKWASVFVQFIRDLTQNAANPEAIVIYPPFSSYMPTIEEFLNVYCVFQNEIKKVYPDTLIMIRNRNKAIKREMDFLINNIDDIKELSKAIEKYKLDLRISLDLTQLFEAQNYQVRYFYEEECRKLFGKLKKYKEYIYGIHIFGKMVGPQGRPKVTSGNFDSRFGVNKKQVFLQSLSFVFDDELERYFVPEINSGIEDMSLIIDDLQSVGFSFS